MEAPQLLVHDKKDTVGVVVVEGLKAGTDMLCVVTQDDSDFRLTARQDIPIGHKVALVDIKAGDTIWKYGQDVGRAVADIGKGEHVDVRNHVVILPLDDLSNAACEAVANNIKGTLALPHAYGRLQFGEDLDLHFRTLIGTGSNPNVAAVVVIGIEDQWTNRVVEGI